MKSTNAVVFITRRLNRKDGFSRKVASIVYNTIFYLLFLVKVKDINSKPKFMKQKFYKELCLHSKEWFIDAEIVLKAINKKFKVVEIPVIHTNRKKGKSKVNINVAKELFFDIIKYRFNLGDKNKN